MISSYIINNLPADQYKGQSNEFVVHQYRARLCTIDQVLLRYHYLLVKKSYAKVPGMDPEDLYQELAMKLVKCCDMWDPTKDLYFSTYLVESCTNHIKWIMRKQLTTNAKKANYDNIVSLDEFVTDDDGDEYCKNEPSVDFEDPNELLIMGLPISAKEKKYLKLIMEGYSNADISRILSVSTANVSVVLRGIGKRLIQAGIKLI